MADAQVTGERESVRDDEFERLFAANERRLRQFLVQMVRDQALSEDLLQDTFLAAYRAREKLDRSADPAAWLFGIARHRALHAMRGRRRMQGAIDRLRHAPPPSDPLRTPIEVMDLLDRVLSPDDRSLVLLRYVHDFDATALAVLTGRSPAATRKRLERACTKLLREFPS